MRGSYEAKHEGTHDHPSGDADILGWGGGAPPGERGDKWLCYGRLSCRTLVVSMLRRVMGECLCAWVGMTKWASEEGNGFAKQCPDASLLSVTRAWRHLSVINAKEKEFPFFWCQ